MSDDPILAAIQATKYAEAIMRRTASAPEWPEDLAHHLDEPTGYNAGYAAYHHPAFAGDWDKAEEAFYVGAGGKGTKFEDGFEDAQNGLPSQLDQVEKRYKPLREVADDLRQRRHNDMSDMGDLTVNEHGMPTRTEGPSTGHPKGSWEGCPTCNPRQDMGSGDYQDPDENIDPFDPRLIGAGLHARLAAQAAAVNPGVLGRIAAELSPPCPDCGQVAGFEPHMVSPRIKACRNCGWTMTDYGVDDLLNETLRGHDREVSDLPETDHPTLGKHGAISRDSINRLEDEFYDWHENESGGLDNEMAPDYDPDRGPISYWPHIENFLSQKYPAAFRGHGAGRENAGRILEGHPPEDGMRGPGDETPYETGPEAVAKYGYDPAETAASMVFLHGRTDPHADPSEYDQGWLANLFHTRQKMQRNYEQNNPPTH